MQHREQIAQQAIYSSQRCRMHQSTKLMRQQPWLTEEDFKLLSKQAAMNTAQQSSMPQSVRAHRGSQHKDFGTVHKDRQATQRTAPLPTEQLLVLVQRLPAQQAARTTRDIGHSPHQCQSSSCGTQSVSAYCNSETCSHEQGCQTLIKGMAPYVLHSPCK